MQWTFVYPNIKVNYFILVKHQSLFACLPASTLFSPFPLSFSFALYYHCRLEVFFSLQLSFLLAPLPDASLGIYYLRHDVHATHTHIYIYTSLHLSASLGRAHGDWSKRKKKIERQRKGQEGAQKNSTRSLSRGMMVAWLSSIKSTGTFLLLLFFSWCWEGERKHEEVAVNVIDGDISRDVLETTSHWPVCQQDRGPEFILKKSHTHKQNRPNQVDKIFLASCFFSSGGESEPCIRVHKTTSAIKIQ